MCVCVEGQSGETRGMGELGGWQKDRGENVV